METSLVTIVTSTTEIMHIGPTFVHDSYAEAFRMRFARLIITAAERYWVEAAAREATGFAASVIGCDAEAGIEQWLAPADTPDGRPGASILLFGMSVEGLQKVVPLRVGQCVMTCATTAVFDGLPGAVDRVPLGKHLRYFGDGYQKSKLIAGRRLWRIPVMDGEFLVDATAGIEKGVAGGSLIVQGRDQMLTLAAARRAAQAIEQLPGVIAPFPGGVVRSGSKVGARYRGLRASTNEAWCPTLRGNVASAMDAQAECSYELVIDGVDETHVARSMAVAARAAAGADTLSIAAANFGGNLGKFHFYLREVLTRFPADD